MRTGSIFFIFVGFMTSLYALAGSAAPESFTPLSDTAVVEQMPEIAALIYTAAAEMRGVGRPGEHIQFSNAARNALRADDFHYRGFGNPRFKLMHCYRHEAKPHSISVAAIMVFSDALLRHTTLSIFLEAGFRNDNRNIYVDSAKLIQMVPVQTKSTICIVPASRVPRDLLVTHSHTDLLPWIIANRATNEEMREGSANDCFIFAVCYDRLLLGDKLGIELARNTANGKWDAVNCKDLNYENWHLAVLRGEFNWSAEKPFSIRLVRTSADADKPPVALASLSSKLKPLATPGTGKTSITLTPDADTHVYAYDYRGWNTANWGKYDVLGAGWNPIGGEKRAYLHFKLPEISKVSSAKLQLYQYHKAGSRNFDLAVHKVTGPWREGRGEYPDNDKSLPGELNWGNQPEFEPRPTVIFKLDSKTDRWIEVDLTNLVNEWLSESQNNGLMMKVAMSPSRTGSECVYNFRAREHADPALRPRLVLNIDADSENEKSKKRIFRDDFSSSHSNWQSDGFSVELRDEALHWNDPKHRALSSNFPVPLENFTLEYDAWCGEDGLPVRISNDDDEGYVIVAGSWHNTRSHAARIGDPIEWRMGSHIELKKWQHYRIVRQGDLLEVHVDGQKIISKTIPGRYDGDGRLRFYSYSPVAIDNVSVSLN
jgi:hypothetical protein